METRDYMEREMAKLQAILQKIFRLKQEGLTFDKITFIIETEDYIADSGLSFKALLNIPFDDFVLRINRLSGEYLAFLLEIYYELYAEKTEISGLFKERWLFMFNVWERKTDVYLLRLYEIKQSLSFGNENA